MHASTPSQAPTGMFLRMSLPDQTRTHALPRHIAHLLRMCSLDNIGDARVPLTVCTEGLRGHRKRMQPCRHTSRPCACIMRLLHT